MCVSALNTYGGHMSYAFRCLRHSLIISIIIIFLLSLSKPRPTTGRIQHWCVDRETQENLYETETHSENLEYRVTQTNNHFFILFKTNTIHIENTCELEIERKFATYDQES